MLDEIPEGWLDQPPQLLVVGESPFARALGGILGIDPVAPGIFQGSGNNSPHGNNLLVLSRLRLVFVVAGPRDVAGDLVALHRGLWEWVVRLTADQEEHRLRLVFILPPPFDRLASSLASGLAFPSLEAAGKACSIIAMGLPLTDLLTTAAATPMTDFVAVRGRFRADLRRNTLRQLAGLVSRSDSGSDVAEAIRDAAVTVMEVFRNQEHDLDLFCCSPRHRNGNLLRQWLGHAVTGMVTPLDWKTLLVELD